MYAQVISSPSLIKTQLLHLKSRKMSRKLFVYEK